MTKFKSFASAALTMTMVVSMVPAMVFAASDGWTKKSDGKWYYYEDGKKVKNTTEYCDEDNCYYLLGSDGARVTAKGWAKAKVKYWIGGDKYYMTYQYYLKKGGAVTTGWKTIKKKEYYFGNDGIMFTSQYALSKDGKKLYLLGDDGARITKKGWATVNTFYYTTGARKETKELKYYLKKDGSITTGWKTIKGKEYHCDSRGLLDRDGTFSAYNKETGEYDLYVAKKSGEVVTKKGLVTVKFSRTTYSSSYVNKTTASLKYYVNKDGKVHLGWKTIDGKKYYFSPYMLASTSITQDNKEYFFDKNGVLTRTVENTVA